MARHALLALALLSRYVAAQNGTEVIDPNDVAAVDPDLELCGDAPFHPDEYVCFDESILCPILYGLTSMPCGSSCYLEDMYTCEAGELVQLPEQQGPFMLTAHSSNPIFDDEDVVACGGYLAMGPGARECTSCYVTEEEEEICDEFENMTVLVAGGEMAAAIPGGQFWFVSPTDGALMFTEEDAGLLVYEEGLAGKDISVYQDGFFVYNAEAPYWIACMRLLPGGTVGTSRVYRIYAPTPENLAREDCTEIKLVTKSVESRAMGAYKYE